MAHFAMSLSELDLGFLAGFLEGEASFTVREQNGGQSYSCVVAVALRDDDQDLIEWMVAMTGIGRLYRAPARATSRPQILWVVDGQSDCLELERLLSRCGFHGRRAAELEIWAAALHSWVHGCGAARRRAMRAHKTRLEALREYRREPAPALPLPTSNRLRLGYISGLACAEGYFGVSRGRPQFAILTRLRPGLHRRDRCRPVRSGGRRGARPRHHQSTRQRLPHAAGTRTGAG